MTKPVLLLLPGLLCDEAVWAPQCAALSDLAHCRVPSYGVLDSITAMAQHVLDTAPTGHFAVAGHSMGGRVALELARLAPQRVARMALLDTGTEAISPGVAGAQERDKRLALLQIAREHGMRAMGQQWARGMVHPSRLDTPVFEAILQMIERKTPEIFAAQIQALLQRPDARPSFAALRCPTLLMCGREDAWSPLQRHEQMQQALPQARLLPIEDCGHMSTMEQPQAVTLGLRDWLRMEATAGVAN